MESVEQTTRARRLFNGKCTEIICKHSAVQISFIARFVAAQIYSFVQLYFALSLSFTAQQIRSYELIG